MMGVCLVKTVTIFEFTCGGFYFKSISFVDVTTVVVETCKFVPVEFKANYFT